MVRAFVRDEYVCPVFAAPLIRRRGAGETAVNRRLGLTRPYRVELQLGDAGLRPLGLGRYLPRTQQARDPNQHDREYYPHEGGAAMSYDCPCVSHAVCAAASMVPS